ncbi:MAG: EAL domain-containing protein, partial [Lachnospiraceae bacterium]|nr:EAL domain-containing protein [Lachnospiraceae bacterium]
EYYDRYMREQVLEEQILTGELTKALENEEIKMYIQPQVDKDGTIIGGECLARWVHPEKGIIPPGSFIPIFEKNGRIADIDRFIWREACKTLKSWQERGRGDLFLSVNISPKDLYVLDIFGIFTSLTKEYGIPAANLRLEITETAVMSDVVYAQGLIRQLQREGFIVEMDDFGSGYSSLNTLKDFSMDVLKIDMNFLKQTTSVQRSRDILESIIVMAEKLRTDVITEGVETEEQYEFLKNIGCKMFQGYLFDKPLTRSMFEAKVDFGQK